MNHYEWPTFDAGENAVIVSYTYEPPDSGEAASYFTGGSPPTPASIEFVAARCATCGAKVSVETLDGEAIQTAIADDHAYDRRGH